MFIAGTSQTKIIGITGTFSMLVILGVVVIMTANRFFSLIHHLPEHVTNWIGRQLQSFGEQAEQSGVKNVFVGSTNAVNSGAQGAKELRSDRLRSSGRQGNAAGTASTADAADSASSGGKTLSENNFRS
jgi:uncharacterized protein HemY